MIRIRIEQKKTTQTICKQKILEQKKKSKKDIKKLQIKVTHKTNHLWAKFQR